MPSGTVTDTWIYNGKTYLPGEHKDMPQDAYDALKAKGAFGGEEEQGAAAPVNQPSLGADPFAEFPQLRSAGYDSIELVQLASDDDLLALDGVGPATLKRIRAAFGDG